MVRSRTALLLSGLLLLPFAGVLLGCPPKPGPEAAFSASPDSGAAPLTVQFTDTSDGKGDTITAWHWNFGDGQTGDDRNPSHTYTSPGSYNVTLTVTTSEGSNTSSPKTIAVAGTPVPLVSLAYFLVKDSDGTHPVEGMGVGLYFEPDGTADLYLGGGVDMLAYTGTYSYTNGQLSLEFKGDDFHPKATFALDTTAPQVTMPFKVFNTDAGTSLWERDEPDLPEAISCIFRCATLADKQSREDAVGRCVEYGNGVIGAKAAKPTTKADPISEFPKTVGATSNGVKIQFVDGPPLEVVLTGLSLDTGGAGLTASPLASDPRIYLETESPHDDSADPLCKRALLIAPFNSNRSLVWYNGYWLNKLVVPDSYNQGIITKTTGFFEFNGMASLLEDQGYSVVSLMDADVTPVKLIDALLASDCDTPGFIVYNTHSGDQGSLATGALVGDTRKYGEGLKAVLDGINASKYASVLTYDGGEVYNPKTFGVSTIFRDGAPRHGASYYLSLTPKFWEWLHSEGVDFSRSLVYIAGCLTDKSPDLREAIHARAYFAFNETTTCEMAGLTFQYLCKFLSKRTRSAEEAFYNINRISKTLQRIYPEDLLFDGTIMPFSQDQVYSTYKIFNGYAYDGTQMVPYKDHGWLANTIGDDKNAGNIWWLLYAARWSANPLSGEIALLDCWDRCWKPGASCGSLGEVFCTNANPGTRPTENETAYALYLLNGGSDLNYTGSKIPRWTLNDGP